MADAEIAGSCSLIYIAGQVRRPKDTVFGYKISHGKVTKAHCHKKDITYVFQIPQIQ